MLVIISDLHLADGTTGSTISSGAFKLFAERLRDMAVEASWREGGSYRPLETLDVVLLGDIIDQIRSTEWTLEDDKGGRTVRPWDDSDLPRFVHKVEHITEHIIQENAMSFQILRNLNRVVRIPKDASAGIPDWGGNMTPVDVRLHYIVGNHDWFLHNPASTFNPIRQKLVDAMGLANRADPFPHELSESPQVQSVFNAHRVFARHGDIYDKINYVREFGRDAASLGDAMVVELFNRFPDRVEQEMIEDLPPDFLIALRELANVRPTLLAPTWIAGMIHRYAIPSHCEKKVKEIWDDLVTRFLHVDFVRSFDKPFKLDMVDLLQGVLMFQKILSFEAVSKLVMSIQEKAWGGTVSYAEHALSEETIRTKQAKFVVYGHTHHQEVIPLDTSEVRGRPFDQVYINSGTWRPLHELTRYDPEAKRFVTYKVMTYTAFYKDDERKGRPFETWSGVLSSLD